MSTNHDTLKMAQNRLQISAYREIRTLSCEYCDGVLVLRGQVASYHYKQLAQEVVKGLPGVLKVVNGIEVIDRQDC